MKTPILERLAVQAARDSRAGDRSTFTRFSRSLRGPVLRRFAFCYYAALTGA